MVQGFKPSKPAAQATASKNRVKNKTTKTGPKIGRRVIHPKKVGAVQSAKTKQKQQASLTEKIEQEMVGRAARGGPLSIMKAMAEPETATKK